MCLKAYGIQYAIHSSTIYQCQWSHRHQYQHRDQHVSKQVSPNYSFQKKCPVWYTYTAFQSCDDDDCIVHIRHQASTITICLFWSASTSNLWPAVVLCHSISLCEGLTTSTLLRETTIHFTVCKATNWWLECNIECSTTLTLSTALAISICATAPLHKCGMVQLCTQGGLPYTGTAAT